MGLTPTACTLLVDLNSQKKTRIASVEKMIVCATLIQKCVLVHIYFWDSMISLLWINTLKNLLLLKCLA